MNIKSGKWCLLTYRQKQISVIGVEPSYRDNSISHLGHFNDNTLKGNGLTSIGNEESHKPIIDNYTAIGKVG